MLAGAELLAKIDELGDVSKSELVRACGYVSVLNNGRERLHFTAFYEALLLATENNRSAISSGNSNPPQAISLEHAAHLGGSSKEGSSLANASYVLAAVIGFIGGPISAVVAPIALKGCYDNERRKGLSDSFLRITGLESNYWAKWFVHGLYATPILWLAATGLGWNFDPLALAQSAGRYKSYKDWSVAEKEARDKQNALREQELQRVRIAERMRREEKERANAALRAEQESRERAAEEAREAEMERVWQNAEAGVEQAIKEKNQVRAMKLRLGNADSTILWAHLFCLKMDETNDARRSIDFASIGAFGVFGIREYKLTVASEHAVQICPQHINQSS